MKITAEENHSVTVRELNEKKMLKRKNGWINYFIGKHFDAMETKLNEEKGRRIISFSVWE